MNNNYKVKKNYIIDKILKLKDIKKKVLVFLFFFLS